MADIEYLKQQVEIKRAEYELARLNLENASKSQLIQLPDDIFMQILSRIPMPDLWKLRRVSRKFRIAYRKSLQERFQRAVEKLTPGTRFNGSSYWGGDYEVIKQAQQKNGLFLHFKYTCGEREYKRKGKLKVNKQYDLECSYMYLSKI